MDHQENGLHKAIGFFGRVVGLAVAILFGPDLYRATKPWMYGHLRHNWDRDIAEKICVGLGFLEGLGLYALVSLGFTLAVLTLITAWAARRFRGA